MAFVFTWGTSLLRTVGCKTQQIFPQRWLHASSLSSASSGAATVGTDEFSPEGNTHSSEIRIDSEFRAGRSVEFWKTFDSLSPSALQNLLFDLRRDIIDDPSSLPYYTYCFGRSLFFASQGLLSLQIQSMQSSKSRFSTRSVTPSSHLAEAGYAFRQDWKNIQRGVYKRPWDISLRHRQLNPAYIISNMIRFQRAAQDTLSKRRSENPSIDVWMSSESFPEYYKQSFHFQTDGWMSSKSADVYEMSTETLFLGRQDAMQRLALIALSDLMRQYDRDETPKALELGAGTGRLATFVLDNFPSIDYTLNDLSPFYLEKARDNVEYWKRFIGADGRTAQVSYLHGAAENLPLPSQSVDIIFAVYLFHELPPEARRKLAKEVGRLLKPGGMFALVDSIQIGDRDSRNDKLDNFEKFNEPWYSSYLREDFGKLFKEFGLVPCRKEISSASKLLTFKKEI